MNLTVRRSWIFMIALALTLMGVLATAHLVSGQEGQAPSLRCEATKSIEESQTDTDSDGLTDDQEKSGVPANSGARGTEVKTNPDDPDTDGDGICDGDEVYGFDMTLDPDGKGIELVEIKTNPANQDTDNDGAVDGQERSIGTSPLNANDYPTPTLTPTPDPTPEPTPTLTPTLIPTLPSSPTPKPTTDSTQTTPQDTAPMFQSEASTLTLYVAGKPILGLTLPAATGGDGALNYKVNGLPPRLEFDQAARVISGTPTRGGRFEVTYTVTDSDAADPESHSLKFNIDVKFPPPDNVTVNDDGLIEWAPAPVSGGSSYEAQYRIDGSQTWDMAFSEEGEASARIPTPTPGGAYQVQARVVYKPNPELNSGWSQSIDWTAPAATSSAQSTPTPNVAKALPTQEPATRTIGSPDTDLDGLIDSVEKDGYQIAVTLINGSRTKMWVSSDPHNPDTDGDGLNDYAERTANMDPRRTDTDGDGITDRVEAESVPAFQLPATPIPTWPTQMRTGLRMDWR